MLNMICLTIITTVFVTKHRVDHKVIYCCEWEQIATTCFLEKLKCTLCQHNSGTFFSD